nr:alpha/beta fold hydrolase [Parvularcula mediterranea]
MASVICVHGTFDNDKTTDGDRWWQHGSPMHADLERAGYHVEAFQWSGNNSDRDRMVAAQRLAKQLDAIEDPDTLILAHSHGGNVAREALVRSRKNKTARLITVGTPFLDRKRPLHQMLLAGVKKRHGFIFAVLAILSFVSLGIIGQLSMSRAEGQLFAMAAAAPTVLYGIFLIFQTVRGIILNPNRYSSVAKRITAIAHEDDEAIAFLSNVRKLKIKVVTVSSLAKSFRNNAPMIFNQLALVGFLGLLGYMAWLNFTNQPPPTVNPNNPIPQGNSSLEDTLDQLKGMAAVYGLIAIIAFPFLISLAAIGTTLVRLIAPVIAHPIAAIVTPIVNAAASSGVITSSLGMDDGYPIKRVGDRPESGAAKFVSIPNNLAKALSDHADTHMRNRVSDLRHTLTSKPRRSGDIFNEVQETFTWDEMIHTSYFRVASFRDFTVQTLRKMAQPGSNPRSRWQADPLGDPQADGTPLQPRRELQAGSSEGQAPQNERPWFVGDAEAPQAEHQEGQSEPPLEVLRRVDP